MSSNRPVMTDEQREVIETWGVGLAVSAGAGTGKTTTLVSKCAELLLRDSEARLTAVSFTERSAGDLRAKLALQVGSLQALSRHWVMTIHGLCGAILREFPRQAGFDGDERMLSETESQVFWERATDSLWFDDLPEKVDQALQALLVRGSRDETLMLVRRIRDLELQGAVERLSDHGDDQSLKMVSRFVLERYERLKKRVGAIDFGDLERGADRALDHREVRETYHRRYALVLVDEFQDTNPLQARIIWRFSRPDLSNLCVVGDPKQSIYRFRDADVSVFEECCRQMPKRLSLTWNFRSRPALIEFANSVCKPAFAASDMAYEPLIAKREPDDAVQSTQVLERVEIEDPLELARLIERKVREGTRLDQMALLLRKIRGNERWLRALTSQGIPIAVGSGGLFWEDARVRELVAFLRWWDQPQNELSAAVFFRAPWMGIQDPELDQWIVESQSKGDSSDGASHASAAAPGPQASWTDRFFSGDHPVSRLLAPFRSGVHRPGELLLALLEYPPIEAELGVQCLGLWHRAEELSARGMSFHTVVQELNRALADLRRERDVPPPRNQGQLLVLTVHGSKGLEFDTVILVDMPSRPHRAPHAPLLFWDRVEGPFLGQKDEDGERIKDSDEEKKWRALENTKNIAESKRVFYVALTRAKERCLLVYPGNASTGVGADEDAPPSTYHRDFWRGWIEESGAIDQVQTLQLRESGANDCQQGPAPIFGQRSPQKGPFDERREPALTSRLAIQERVRPRYNVTEWNLLSHCPRAFEWSGVRPRVVDLKTEQSRSNSSALITISRADLGTAVHHALEQQSFDALAESLIRLEREVGRDRFNASPLIEWAKASPWMQPPDLCRGHKVWSELAFEIPIAGEALVGSMDRLVGHEGRYTVIDFKVSDRLRDPQELIVAYQTQLDLYAEAVGVLAPESRGQVSARIVQITPAGVQEIEVDPRGPEVISRLAATAAAILSGQEGEARPGPTCRYCDFNSICDAAL